MLLQLSTFTRIMTQILYLIIDREFLHRPEMLCSSYGLLLKKIWRDGKAPIEGLTVLGTRRLVFSLFIIECCQRWSYRKKTLRSEFFIVRGELLTIARFGVESLVGLRSRSCPDRDHAKQVLAGAEWLSGFRMQHAAQGQHRLRHQDLRADVEVARRFLRAADEFD